jgi:glutamate decarboxylase
MLHQSKNNQKLKKVHPAETLALYDDIDIPKYTMRQQSLPPDVAYRLIKNELLDEGNARQSGNVLFNLHGRSGCAVDG